MRVLKIVAEGLTTSFRYPHFVMQVQPTFLVPPPATIYGHIASALGDWFDPAGVRFAYHFTYRTRVRDLEHTILLSPGSGKLASFPSEPEAMRGAVNPFERELLFLPRLTLYLNRPEWIDAFRSPRYAVALGRSQDLFTYTSVEVTDLAVADDAYFEHTLLPYDANRHTARGFAVLMPRYVDGANRRRPSFGRYLVVQDRVHTNDPTEYLWFGERPAGQFLVDPDSPEHNGLHLGLSFLGFVDDER